MRDCSITRAGLKAICATDHRVRVKKVFQSEWEGNPKTNLGAITKTFGLGSNMIARGATRTAIGVNRWHRTIAAPTLACRQTERSSPSGRFEPPYSSLPIDSGPVYNLHAGNHRVLCRRINIAQLLVRALVLLLLCGIVAGEFPELVSLTDNAANDFTVRRTDSVGSPALLSAKRHVRITEMVSNTHSPQLPFSQVSPFEKAAFVPSDAFLLHSILRT
jgi:hypothetical protein